MTKTLTNIKKNQIEVFYITGSRSPEEIIALRECGGRASPLLGLRSRPLPTTGAGTPSLRIQRDHTNLRYRTRPHSRNSRSMGLFIF